MRPATTAAADPAAYPPLAGTDTGGTAARRYHARYGSVLPAIDLTASNTPPKHHPGARVVPLPFPPGSPAAPANGTDPAALDSLGTLLALLCGVTRIDWTGAGVGGGRPVPSGGGAYPGEVYAATASGLCHYLPAAHALELLSPADLRADVVRALGRPPVRRPELVLLITTRQDANLARYGPFGHRLQALDTGVLTGQALTLLAAAGAEPTAHALFAEQALGGLLGLDPGAERVHAVVTADPVGPLAPTAELLNRRSARGGFEPAPVPLAQLVELLDRATAPFPLDGPNAPDGPGCELYVVGGRVTGLAPGCHRRDPRTGELVAPTPGATPRDLFPPGGPGELAGFEAACALLVVGDYEQGYPEHGDRWYRMLNLRAGILGQRIGLAAARVGLGAGLRCDFVTTGTDRLLGPALATLPGRTTLLTVLIGPERGSGTPAHHLLATGGHR
ncbi:nitroreductase family protein [Kitasatospora sp. NBC_01302]|uniref:nitroreductase family protein n=1 Tax=Kitasatospora sp. NBC_01302 TaxID=2903575 RepID=UPI002E10603D|nr:nitroreductase family protein [Kitasatospora sp. NBC_01302]